MSVRWSCVLLLLGLAACRTPHKSVGVYSLDDDGSSTDRHLQTGSDVGETVTGRMNLPNYADTETATNSARTTASMISHDPALASETLGGRPASAPTSLQSTPAGLQTGEERLAASTNSAVRIGYLPDSANVRTGGSESVAALRIGLPEGPPLLAVTNRSQQHLEIGAALPLKQAAPANPLNFQMGGNQSRPAGASQSTAQINLRTNRNPSSPAPAGQPIHLSLPSGPSSAPRQTVELARLPAGGSIRASQPVSTRVNLPVGDRGIAVDNQGLERPVVIPEVGRGATGVVEAVAQPVDLAPLLAVAHDADWRQRQAERQRAAETARQAERDSLEKSLQQFLQPAAK